MKEKVTLEYLNKIFKAIITIAEVELVSTLLSDEFYQFVFGIFECKINFLFNVNF